ncbi:hypothetical protein MMC12_003171 [Toensbergia leucococca]|nr:hypothetical protein [Toensbergia leucococca]
MTTADLLSAQDSQRQILAQIADERLKKVMAQARAKEEADRLAQAIVDDANEQLEEDMALARDKELARAKETAHRLAQAVVDDAVRGGGRKKLKSKVPPPLKVPPPPKVPSPPKAAPPPLKSTRLRWGPPSDVHGRVITNEVLGKQAQKEKATATQDEEEEENVEDNRESLFTYRVNVASTLRVISWLLGHQRIVHEGIILMLLLFSIECILPCLLLCVFSFHCIRFFVRRYGIAIHVYPKN